MRKRRLRLSKGTPILSWRRLRSQQSGGAIHYSDRHRPVAPSATCPPDRPATCPSAPPGTAPPARSFAKTACQPLPLSGQGLIPPGSPAPDPPRAVCLGHLLPRFCLRQPVLGERGVWVLGTQRAERPSLVGVGGEQRVLTGHFVSWREHFSRSRLCSSLKMLAGRSRLCRSHVSGAPNICLRLC